MLTRNVSIDVLRFIGISFIILAHVLPPCIILNIRCFDVPLMLFVSGLIYSDRKVDLTFSFFWHRIKRLIIPVYIFLTVYFAFIFFLKYFLLIDFGITIKHVVGSYLLMDGIGFVWIIRVFLIIAVLTPWLIRINNVIKKNRDFILGLVILILFQEYVISHDIGMDIIAIREFLYYASGYSILFLLGLRVKNMNVKGVLYYCFTSVLLFVLYMLYLCVNMIDLSGGG